MWSLCLYMFLFKKKVCLYIFKWNFLSNTTSFNNKTMKQRWKFEGIEKCDVMVYTKIFLKFPDMFWPSGPEMEFFIYAHERRGYYTFWQVCYKFSFIAASWCISLYFVCILSLFCFSHLWIEDVHISISLASNRHWICSFI